MRYRDFCAAFSLTGALLLSGCGGGGSADMVSVVTPSNDSTLSCQVDDINKSNLPPLPSASSFSANPLFSQQWAINYDENFYWHAARATEDASIHMEPEHRFLGRGIKVAVIDNGLDLTHEDLRGAVAGAYDVESKSSDVQPTEDEQNHGTEVTGVIAARNNGLGLVGVAPEVQIYFIRLPFDREVSISDIVEAFEKAAAWGADVINCSWGSGDVNDAVRSAIVDVAKNGRDGKGTIVVFAAGNGGIDGKGDPIGNDESSIPEVIAVGATNIYNERAEYSNYGEALDLMAPGGEYTGLATLDQMGSAGTATNQPNYLEYNDAKAFVGTSAATPVVTGVVALLLEANPNLTREEVLSLLACSAEKIGDRSSYADGRNDYYGYGKVNVVDALNLAR
ncbi:S8 family peptidase [Hydrogenimonas cancrithermarum]|uniref:Peptidase S8/S53 domain-containing protein n=1 Tax=Hydrogenimonas cancrithermarum TaxID=2993563 RepID=A0ABN6WWA7_9BACT|nr:S8 family serine peptidase [Hydrogenimonas cancrithermarum]BDY13390.1 hypothetical protein HCR_17020 [Hydrogenimonas cancrithermarum]